MIDISVEDNAIIEAEKLLAAFPGTFKKAVNTAAKKSAAPFKQAAVDETSKKYFINTNKFKREIKTIFYNNSIHFFMRGPRHSLGSFLISPSKRPKKRMRGLWGAVKKSGGLKFFPSGFLLRNNLPVMRVGKRKKDIRAIYGPAYSQIMKQPDNILPVMEITKEKFLKNLNHEVLFRLGALKK